LKLAVTAASDLMEALRRLVPGASNRTLRQMLEQRRVLVNGVECRVAARRLDLGDSVEVVRRRPRPPAFDGLDVVHEDETLLIVHKPVGLLSVATPDEREQTAFAFLRAYLRQSDRNAPLFIVHRLDKFVSGLLVFAKSVDVQARLKALFEGHAIERRYWALVEGHVKEDTGTIRTRLTEDRSLKMRSTRIDSEGKLAVTHFRVLRRFPGLTLLEVKLETGRKNQIRVHLSEHGHPIVGDRGYGSTVDPLGRMGLHAFRLGFVHPITGERLDFQTDSPPEFARYLRAPVVGAAAVSAIPDFPAPVTRTQGSAGYNPPVRGGARSENRRPRRPLRAR
jgi:23S rRNA pseudouridine1911/1915/1917 synthase